MASVASQLNSTSSRWSRAARPAAGRPSFRRTRDGFRVKNAPTSRASRSGKVRSSSWSASSAGRSATKVGDGLPVELAGTAPYPARRCGGPSGRIPSRRTSAYRSGPPVVLDGELQRRKGLAETRPANGAAGAGGERQRQARRSRAMGWQLPVGEEQGRPARPGRPHRPANRPVARRGSSAHPRGRKRRMRVEEMGLPAAGDHLLSGHNWAQHQGVMPTGGNTGGAVLAGISMRHVEGLRRASDSFPEGVVRSTP